jgi:oligoribonuclease NrnB/cAMP/cGMP phosphodiesterase (DHH superfamily)
VTKATVIYHAGCVDGFTAAWVLWTIWGDEAEYIPAHYGSEPPDVTVRDVYVVDFSYPRETLLEMATAASLRVLDHHKTARADLEGLDFCTFDMGRSGAGLAWDELCGGPRPPLVDYVEDRDLWQWRIEDSKAVSAYIATVERTFENWDKLSHEIRCSLSDVVSRGEVALRVVEQYVESQRYRSRTATIGGHIVPCINTTFATSELVGALAESAKFAAGWFQRDDGMFIYSLRSRGDFDVSEIAHRYGGGGHKNAAGFQSEVLL